jgi:phosphoribosylglycinamide formyltransferase-1
LDGFNVEYITQDGEIMKKRITIFISGRGSNMEAIVKNARTGNLKDCCEVVLVFANQKDARGLEIAQKLGVKTAVIESKGKKREDFDREIVSLLEPFHIDYIVLAGYMRIVSPVLIERYKNQIINIHPADTALYQGTHAYQWAFENKLEATKITVHLIDEGVDTGPVLAQRDVDLKGAKSLEEVEQRGLRVEHAFYSEILEKIFTEKIKIKIIKY